MSTRLVLQQVIDNNVYDNNNKEILASMLRTVFESIVISDFNKDDDELQNLKYNATQTLAQFFATLPNIKKCTIGSFDVGVSGTQTLDVSGDIILSATLTSMGGSDTKIVVDFSEDISAKKFIFTYSITGIGDTALNAANDILPPVYRIDTPTRISLGIREVSNNTQNVYLNILIL
jgi:hypothetical protein